MIKKLYKKIIPEKNRNNIHVFIQKLSYPLYLGNKYYCNCCDKSFRKFLPKGNIKRPNAKCPYCSSLERVRLLDLYLKNETDIFQKENIKILHFAPEESLFKKLNRPDITYIDGDINPAYARNIIDITNIQFEDEYFDYIICSHVLGHVPNEEKAIDEMYRVLKIGGNAFVMTLLNQDADKTYEDPKITTANDRLIYYGEPDLCRLHGKDFSKRLSKSGFEVERIFYKEKLDAMTLKKGDFGNGDREIIFKCTKQK